MRFVYNDGGRSRYFEAKNVGDCAVRAIANATGIDYKKVYDDLKRLNGGKSCRNGTPKNVDKKYLTELGWVWHSCMGIGQGCSVHLDSNELPSGTLVVQVSGHLTCVKDGVLYDTYDCTRGGYRCVYGYWTKPTQESLKRLEMEKQEAIEKQQAKEKEKQIRAKIKAEKEKIKKKFMPKIKKLEKELEKALKQVEAKYNK